MHKKSRRVRYLKDYGLKSFGFIILLIILFFIPYTDILARFSTLNKTLFYISLLLTIPVLLLRSYRWNIIKHLQGVHYSAIDSFLIYLVGFVTGTITTRHYGDNVKSKYLRKKGYNYGDSFITIVIDRIMDIFILLFLFFIGVVLFIHKLNMGWLYYLFVFFIFLILSTIVLSGIIYRRYLRKVVFVIIQIFVPDRYRFSFQKSIDNFFVRSKKHSKKNYRSVIILSLLSWIVCLFQTYLFVISLSIDVNFFYLIVVLSFSSLITLFPISILGIGTRDLIFIIAFSLLGLSPVDALALSLCVFITFIFASLIGAFAFIKKPVNL